MKNVLFRFVIAIFCAFSAIAQSPPSGLNGTNLRTWLKQNYYDGKHAALGYSEARRQMYNFIDNKSNSITGVYSGYQKSWQFGGTGTNPMPINAEHTVPQSFFDKAEPMRSDIHHLFPTHVNWNSVRSNHKFAEISDSRTQKWMYLTNEQSTIPRTNINAYSESDGAVFEPREIQKGNTARAIFYFYTMYPNKAGSINSLGNINTLYQWHLDDPVDAIEYTRNNAIEQVQGNRNPYIDQPSLVGLAWGFTSTPTPTPTPTPVPTTNTLFISEYVEGTSNNKAIEIANQTGRTITMSSYSIRKQTNGSGNWSSDFYLSGSLGNGDVYVIGNSNATSDLSSRANVLTGNSIITFNGNDPIGLFKNGQLVDIVGRFNGGSNNFAKDRTLIRVATITTGSTTYNPSNWKAYIADTFAALGDLNLGRKTLDNQDLLSQTDQITTIDVYPNPSNGNTTIIVPAKANDSLQLGVYSISGKLVYTEQRIANGKERFELKQLARGVYLVKIIGTNINAVTKFTVN